ncbi:MAG: hypothetical protein R2806_03045 [Saprospiraceae bacterium]
MCIPRTSTTVTRVLIVDDRLVASAARCCIHRNLKDGDGYDLPAGDRKWWTTKRR